MRSALVLAAMLAAAGEGPTETLKQRDVEIRAVLPPDGQEVTPAARSRLEKILTRAIDLRTMAESALGARWKEMTEKQRKRLLAAFERRFQQVGSSELDGYRSTQIQYKPEEKVGDDLVKVPTQVDVKGEPTEITYAMRRSKEGWRIVDIVVDGVSTVENYRASFARVIAKEGVEGLIGRLSRGAAKAAGKKS